jgi:hypothetical protein
MVIRQDQTNALRAGLRASFVRRMAAHLRDDFADDLKRQGLSAANLEPTVDDGMKRADEWGLTRQDHVQLFLECIAILGPSFDTTNGIVQGILSAPRRNAEEKMAELNDYLLFGLDERR